MTRDQLHAYIRHICDMPDEDYDALAGPLPADESGPDWRELKELREQQQELADHRAAQERAR